MQLSIKISVTPESSVLGKSADVTAKAKERKLGTKTDMAAWTPDPNVQKCKKFSLFSQVFSR